MFVQFSQQLPIYNKVKFRFIWNSIPKPRIILYKSSGEFVSIALADDCCIIHVVRTEIGHK